MNITHISKKNPDLKNQWYLINAENKTLGRLSTQIANVLRGKNQITYTPYLENNSYVIVINSELVNITGQKALQKTYKRHSGRPGGLKIETFENLKKRIPNRIIEKSVKGMLPKGPIGRKAFRKLKIYSGNNHPHSAQKPQHIALD